MDHSRSGSEVPCPSPESDLVDYLVGRDGVQEAVGKDVETGERMVPQVHGDSMFSFSLSKLLWRLLYVPRRYRHHGWHGRQYVLVDAL